MSVSNGSTVPPSNTRVFLSFLPQALCAAILCGIACSGPPPRTANPTRPLDERRDIELIVEAFKEERDHAVPGGDVNMAEGKKLHVDVTAQGRRYGVAYVTGAELRILGPVFQAR